MVISTVLSVKVMGLTEPLLSVKFQIMAYLVIISPFP